MILTSITIALALLAGYFAWKQSTTAAKLSNLAVKHETVLKYVESLEAQQQKPRAEATTKKKGLTKPVEAPVSTRGRKPKSK